MYVQIKNDISSAYPGSLYLLNLRYDIIPKIIIDGKNIMNSFSKVRTDNIIGRNSDTIKICFIFTKYTIIIKTEKILNIILSYFENFPVDMYDAGYKE